MPDRDSGNLLIALGYTPQTSRFYDQLLALNGRPVEEVVEVLGLAPAELEDALEPLREYEVAGVEHGLIRVRTPSEAMSTMLRISADRARQAHDRLITLAQAMPYVAGSTVRAPAAHIDDERPLDGELVTSGSMLRSLQAMIHETSGDMMWLRPDMWGVDYTRDLDALAASGRRVRAIYPARALTEVPQALADNAAHGEQIRILPEVSVRLMAISGAVAVLPEPVGLGTSPRVVVRQRALIDVVAAYFDALWLHAAPVYDFHRATDTARRLLLQQLAQGAQDEQIARRLGVSLRTVRRRVAELMTELQAESRFQAGVEAARRGWL